jgi:hypothetical protein
VNVTVHVAPALSRVMEGRRRLELGLPAGAGPAELWDTLLSLYPGLRACLPGDRGLEPRLVGLLWLSSGGSPSAGAFLGGVAARPGGRAGGRTTA